IARNVEANGISTTGRCDLAEAFWQFEEENRSPVRTGCNLRSSWRRRPVPRFIPARGFRTFQTTTRQFSLAWLQPGTTDPLALWHQFHTTDRRIEGQWLWQHGAFLVLILVSSLF